MLKTAVHPDFLTFTFPASSLAEGCGVVEKFLTFNPASSGNYSLEGKRPLFFLQSDVGLMAQFKEIKQNVKCRLELGGSYFRTCLDLIAPLHQVFKIPDSNITRFDIAIDDYTRRVSPLDVYGHCQQGNFKLFRSYELQQSSLRDGSPASTLYLGTKGKSEKLLRIYDALPIHDINAIRWELQLRRSKASLAVDLTCLSSEPLRQMASFLTGSVDFGDFSGLNISRDFSRFDWWQSLINDTCSQPEKITFTPRDQTLEKMINWVRSQCSPSLGVLLRALGVNDFSKFVLDSSTPRMKQHHYLLVQKLLNLKEDGINLI